MDDNKILEKELTESFKNLDRLVELIEDSQRVGLLRLNGDQVLVFDEVWDRWNEKQRNAFAHKIMGYYKIKFADSYGNTIDINSIPSNRELGFILTDMWEFIEAI